MSYFALFFGLSLPPSTITHLQRFGRIYKVECDRKVIVIRMTNRYEDTNKESIYMVILHRMCDSRFHESVGISSEDREFLKTLMSVHPVQKNGFVIDM